jgi:F1F0 ATPase subunit 2
MRMTTTELSRLAISLVAGGLLGAGYFGGLYLTVKRVGQVSSPQLLLVASFLVRLLVVLGAFYLLSAWGALAMMTGMGGFLIARLAWLRSRYGRGG